MPSTSAIIRQREKRRGRARHGARQLLHGFAGATLITALAVVLALIGAAGAAATVYAYYTRDLPSAEALQAAIDPANPEFFQTTRIYDRTGQHVLLEIIDPHGGDRQYVTYDEIPPQLILATVIVEDKTFFSNPGYDLFGIVRALVVNLRGGEVQQGGSSITQQLVKNTLIPLAERTERSYSRKVREILLASEITRRYSKQQLLEWYLNTNFYGNLAYGVDAAALVYFGKHARDLDLAESAMLAAVPESPGLNPIDAPEAAKQRQEAVLGVMVSEGVITAAEASAARNEVLHIQPPAQRFDIVAPHFAQYVRRELVKMFGEDLVNRGGLQVITSLDLDLQLQAECAARTQIARLSGQDPATVVPAEGLSTCAAAQFLPPIRESDVGVDHHVTNTALVAIRPTTGEILALVGSRDFADESIDGQFNVAVDGLRQPGSSFKPYTYLEAFRQGYTPASMLLDIPTTFTTASGEPYAPENYDRQFHGPVSMRVALARSYNMPAVETMNLVGIDNVIRLAHRLGLNTLEPGQYGLALTLGGGEVTLLDHTYAYSVLANMGVMAGQPIPPEELRPGYRMLDPISILRVQDHAGKILYQMDTPQTQPVLSADLAYLINNVLSDNDARVAAFGRGNPLELRDRPAAAKTGTTNDFRDNWTVGYVPQLAVGVWVGNSDNSEMKGVTGLTGAAPIWHAVMSYAAQTLPPQEWSAPEGIVSLKVCVPSGLLPTPECPQTRNEVFIHGTEPNTPDNIWQTVAVNKDTGRRATACTPPELVEQRVFEILPPEAADWARQTNLAQPPTEYDAIAGTCLPAGDVAILSPAPFAYVRGLVTISGNAKAGDNFDYFWVQYGPGLFPPAWTKIGDNRGEQIDNNVLQTWDTTGLDGLYTLQLVIVHRDGTFDGSIVQVTVDNQSPVVRLLAPKPDDTYTVGRDESIIIQPQVEDNFSLARVEFYVDGQLVDTATVPPFSTRWKIGSAQRGAHTLSVRAVDAAGNFTDSEQVTITVK